MFVSMGSIRVDRFLPVWWTVRILRSRREANEEFLRVARGGMEQLYKQVSGLGYFLLLADSEGVTLDYIGDNVGDRELRRVGLYLGADLSEQMAGTNGVGTCVVDKEPLICHLTDHFDANRITSTCSSSPLFDPNGDLLGVLDVTSLSPHEGRDSQKLALNFTVLFAKMIESSNFLSHFRDSWVFRLGTANALVDVFSDAMISFNDEGTIVGANSGARERLQAFASDGNKRPLVGAQLAEVFKGEMDAFWRIARSNSMSEQAMLSARTHELFYVSTVPRRYMLPTKRAFTSNMESTGSGAAKYPALDCLAGEDNYMRALIEQTKRFVNRKVNILIRGETGTGKEVLARAIHNSSDRKGSSFVAINCAAIPESLIESELFGYASGSFTGARTKGMRGLVQQADGGTLFLDEIGDMPLPLQTRLLRVLAEKEVMPLGSDKPIPVNLTVISASHRDLRMLIAAQSFREDLYYRLAGATLHLPALRARIDKDHLITTILDEEGADYSPRPVLARDALDALRRHEWPGNIRELRNALRYALAICDDGYVTLSDFPDEFQIVGRSHVDANAKAPAPVSATKSTSELRINPDPKADALLSLLRANKWRIAATSRQLGVCRATVYRRMVSYGIVAPNKEDWV